VKESYAVNSLFGLCVTIAVLGLIELGFRAALSGKDYDPYLQLDSRSSVFRKVMIEGEEHFKVSHAELYEKHNVVFPVKKKEGTFRVFCVGGSASAGWPHPPEERFSNYLSHALGRVVDVPIEVLNVSAHAYASFRVRRIFDEVKNFAPDLIIIYSGNNEFLEKRKYSSGFLGGLRTKIVIHSRFLQMVDALSRPKSNVVSGKRRTGEKWDIWTKVEQVAKELRSDPEQFSSLKKHYRANINYMLDEAEQLNINVLVFTVPVNLRDWRPNVSRIQALDKAPADWADHFYKGRGLLLNNKFDKAKERFLMALDAEPEDALTHFYLARSYEGLSKHVDAGRHYMQARDLDLNPFRSIGSFNDDIRNLAGKYENAYLVDLEVLAAQASDIGVPGNEFFLDYVHPRKSGNLIIAEAAYETIKKHSLLPLKDQSFSSMPSSYDEDTDYELQRHIAWLNLMMHQHERAIELSDALRRAGARTAFTKRGKAHPFDAIASFVVEERRFLMRGEAPSEATRAKLEEAYRRIYSNTYAARDRLQQKKQGKDGG
jgi:tetratricopeptide (TPR) repeat protein